VASVSRKETGCLDANTGALGVVGACFAVFREDRRPAFVGALFPGRRVRGLRIRGWSHDGNGNSMPERREGRKRRHIPQARSS